jgi:chromosome segregation ATPase
LHGEQQARAAIERRLETSTNEHQHAEAELQSALSSSEARTEELDQEMRRLRTEVSERADLQRSLERRLDTAEASRERAETERDQLRTRLASLRALLDGPRAAHPDRATEQAVDPMDEAEPL